MIPTHLACGSHIVRALRSFQCCFARNFQRHVENFCDTYAYEIGYELRT